MKSFLIGAIALTAAIALPASTFAATYDYVTVNGMLSSVVAPDAVAALAIPTDIAPHSGVVLDTSAMTTPAVVVTTTPTTVTTTTATTQPNGEVTTTTTTQPMNTNSDVHGGMIPGQQTATSTVMTSTTNSDGSVTYTTRPA